MRTQPRPTRITCGRRNSAAAYYLARPVAFWIIAMYPPAKRAAVSRARAARHPAPVPLQAGETVPPMPRTSAVHWTPRRRRETEETQYAAAAAYERGFGNGYAHAVADVRAAGLRGGPSGPARLSPLTS